MFSQDCVPSAQYFFSTMLPQSDVPAAQCSLSRICSLSPVVHQSDVPSVQRVISPMFHQPMLRQPIRLPEPYVPSALCSVSPVFHQPCVASDLWSISLASPQPGIPSVQCSISPILHQFCVPSALCSISLVFPQSDQTCCFSLMTSKLLHRVLTRTMMYDDLSDAR